MLVQDNQIRRILPNEELVSVIQQPLYSLCTIIVMQMPKFKSLQVVSNLQIFDDI